MNARILVAVCVAVSFFSRAVSATDKVLIHGHIYTGKPKAPWAQALAISGTRIDAIGSDQEILARKQTSTRIIDLQGRTVIPGISDSHTHMWFGALELQGLNLWTPGDSITPDQPEKVLTTMVAGKVVFEQGN